MRSAGELAGILLGAGAIVRLDLGDTGYAVTLSGLVVGCIWSMQGGSTLAKRRMYVISTNSVVLVGIAYVYSAALQLNSLVVARHALVMVLPACGHLAVGVDMWQGRRYAVARHKVTADGPVWGSLGRSDDAMRIRRGEELLPMNLLEHMEAADRDALVGRFLRLKLFTDDELAEWFFTTSGDLIPVDFWKANLDDSQLELLLSRSTPPDLSEEPLAALQIVDSGFADAVGALSDSEEALTRDAERIGQLFAAVEVIRGHHGLCAFMGKAATIEDFRDQVQNLPTYNQFQRRIGQLRTYLDRVTPDLARRVRRFQAMVLRRKPQDDQKDSESVGEQAFLTFCDYLSRGDEAQAYDHTAVLEALGLPMGVEAPTVYSRFEGIKLTGEEAIKAVVGADWHETEKNLKAKAASFPFVAEDVVVDEPNAAAEHGPEPVNGFVYPSWLERALRTIEPTVLRLLAAMIVAKWLWKSGASHGRFALLGVGVGACYSWGTEERLLAREAVRVEAANYQRAGNALRSVAVSSLQTSLRSQQPFEVRVAWYFAGKGLLSSTALMVVDLLIQYLGAPASAALFYAVSVAVVDEFLLRAIRRHSSFTKVAGAAFHGRELDSLTPLEERACGLIQAQLRERLRNRAGANGG